MSQALAAPAEQRVDPQRLILGLGLLPLIGMLVLVLGIAFGARGPKIAILGLGIATAVLLAIPAVLDQARPAHRRHLLFALLSLIHLLYYVLPIFTRYLPTEFRGGSIHLTAGSFTAQDLITAQLAVLLAVASLMLGYAAPLGRGLASLLPSGRRDWSRGATLAVACIGIPLGWALYLPALFGLLSGEFGSAFFAIFISFTLQGLALLALAYLRFRSRLAFLLLVVLIPITMAVNFFTGSKGRFFGPLLMVFLAYLFAERRIRVSWVAAGVAAIALFYPISHFYRDVVTEGLTRPVGEVLSEPGDVVRDVADFTASYGLKEWFVDGVGSTAARFDGLSILSIIIKKTPAEVPFQGGWTLGYAFIALVPRIVWPGKPHIETGLWVTDNYTRGVGLDTATGSTWIGEFYFNFGRIGIALGMLVIGVVVRFLHEALFRLGGSIPFLLLAVMLFNSVIRAIGGDLVKVVAGITFAFLTVGSIHGIVRFLGGTIPMSSTPSAEAAPASRAAARQPGTTEAGYST